MIRLARGAEPAVLMRHAARWTEDLLEGLKQQVKVSGKWTHTEIKSAVLRDSNDKCVYCESRPEAVDWGDVEHLIPRSRRPDLAYAWDNLMFSCARCNNSKRDHDQEAAPVVDPFNDEPGEHLVFIGPLAVKKSEMGRLTISVLSLNRPGLLEKRGERVTQIHELLPPIRSRSLRRM